MNASIQEKQALLEEDLKKKAIAVLELLTKDLQVLEMKNKIRSKVQTDLDKQQREYYLNQQMKAIQEELGTGSQKKSMILESKVLIKSGIKILLILLKKN